MHGCAEVARIFHEVRRRLFHVGIAARIHGFDAVLRMLEVRRCNQDRIHIFARIKLVVVADRIDLVAGLLRQHGRALVAAHVPDVGDSNELKVHIVAVVQERRHKGLLHPVAATDNGRAHAVVRTGDLSIALSRPVGYGGCRGHETCCFQKLSAIGFVLTHGDVLGGMVVVSA